MKNTLLGRFYAALLALVAFGIGAVSLVATVSVRRFVYGSARSELSDIAKVAEKVFFESGSASPRPGAREAAEEYFSAAAPRITVIAADGTVLADTRAGEREIGNHADRPEIRAALESGEGSAVRRSATIDVELLYFARAVVRGGRNVAVVRASMPLPFLRERLAELYAAIAAGGALALAAATGLAFAFAGRIRGPLSRLAHAARRFGEGDLDYSATIESPDEIRALAETMNSMAGQLRDRIADVEKRRREAEAILAGLQEGVVVLDRRLRVLRANDAARRLLAPAGRQDPEGKTLLDAFRSTDLQRFAERALSGGGSAIEDNLTIWADSPRRLQVYAAPVEGREDCLLVVHDLTRIAQLENVRRDFVANVSHELKTPITAIKGFVETLADGALADGERAARYLGIVAKHADRLERIVEDLLALARLEQQDGAPLVTEPVPLRDVLEDARLVCAHAADEKGIRIDVVCPEDLEVDASASLLEQAFVNLIENAVKYSPEGSTVWAEARVRGEEVEIKVVDRGCGIPAKDKPRIFERFYRVDKARSRDVGGTGLGLSIVKHVVALHGGTVGVESWEDEGSTFTVVLRKAGSWPEGIRRTLLSGPPGV